MTRASTIDFGFEVKDLKEDGTLEGYASIFGNVDQGGDKVMPGAFVESLAAARRSGRTVKMLWNHNQDFPIGVWDDLVEDAKGLRVKGHMIMAVNKAREVHALLKEGAIDGLSIGYKTLKSSPDGNVRQLEKLDLYEISPVTFPMNDRARVQTVKSEVPEDVVALLKAGERLTKRQFEAMAKGLGASNAEAERAARVHLSGQGDPDEAAKQARDFFSALRG